MTLAVKTQLSNFVIYCFLHKIILHKVKIKKTFCENVTLISLILLSKAMSKIEIIVKLMVKIKL